MSIEQNRLHLPYSIDRVLDELSKLKVSPENMPDGGDCFYCKTPIVKKPVSYEYKIKYGESLQITVEMTLPGYHCGQCDVDYFNPQVSEQFMATIAEGLANTGDDTLKRALKGDPSFTKLSPLPDAVVRVLNPTKTQ